MSAAASSRSAVAAGGPVSAEGATPAVIPVVTGGASVSLPDVFAFRAPSSFRSSGVPDSRRPGDAGQSHSSLGLMKRITAASSSAGVLGIVALVTVGLTVAPQAVAATGQTSVPSTLSGKDLAATAESEEVQVYIAPLTVQTDELAYSSYTMESLDASALNLGSLLEASFASVSSTPTEGGLTLAQAEALMADYVSTEETGSLRKGEAVLEALYPDGSGPGDCGSGAAVNMLDNCVGFVTYFMNMYTSFDQYVVANGGQEAVRMAAMLGRSTSSSPFVYSVGSDPSTSYLGHTFVVLGIHDGQAIIGEAACGLGESDGWPRARAVPLSELSGDTFVNVSDLILDEPRSLAEVLGGE